MRRGVTVFCACASLMIVSGIVTADISWTQTDTITAEGDTVTVRQTISVSGNRFAIETDEGMRMVIDMNTGTVTTIDLTDKIYSSSTIAEIEALTESIRTETDTIIEEALKKMPEDQRDAMREQLREALENREEANDAADTVPTPQEYSPTGTSASIAGHTALCFRATDADGTIYEIWCAQDIDTSELIRFFEKAESTSFLEGIGKSYTTLSLGFPLKSVVSGNNERIESTVTAVSFDPLPDSVFSIPNGFRTAPNNR